MQISRKLPLIIVASALALAGAIGGSDYIQASRAARAAIDGSLSAILGARKAALQDYLSSIEQDIRLAATAPTVRHALAEFSRSWEALGEGQTGTLQRLYIEDNPHPTGQKENLDAANDGSAYSRTHGRYHPWFRKFLRERGYYDIFLFDLEGNLVYTVFKELDYATNLVSGQWKDSDLGNVYRAARDSGRPGSISFFDFQPYAPSHGAPASFMSTPILDADGGMIGVLVFQMPIDRINTVMGVTAGLGETGESFLVGEDRLMRSDSRFFEESTILKETIGSSAVTSALAGETGVSTEPGHRGEEVVTAFAPFDFGGVRWAIVAEIDVAEVNAPIVAMRNMMVAIAVVALLVMAAVATLFARRITGPLAQMTEVMSGLAGGDLSVEVPALGRTDEIGAMAQAVQVFKDNAGAMDRMQDERNRDTERYQAELRGKIEHLSDELESAAQSTVAEIVSVAEKVSGAAERMAGSAADVSKESSTVAASAQTATENVQTVAGAAEEISSQVNELSRQVGESTTITERAVGEAEQTNETVRGLARAAEKIGEVADLISDIAEQTNLLALNATIEAARAGEAGKGFAVVASEVKNLANQTAKATDAIGEQIADIQTVSGNVVSAIHGIAGTIEEVNKIATELASSIEEQSKATQLITQNVQQAAEGTREVSVSIGRVSDISEKSGEMAQNVRQDVAEVADAAKALQMRLADILHKTHDGTDEAGTGT